MLRACIFAPGKPLAFQDLHDVASVERSLPFSTDGKYGGSTKTDVVEVLLVTIERFAVEVPDLGDVGKKLTKWGVGSGKDFEEVIDMHVAGDVGNLL